MKYLFNLAFLALACGPAAAQQAHRHGHAGHAHAHDERASAAAPSARPAQPAPVDSDASGSHTGNSHAGHAHDDHGVETESLFGFVLGSDVEPAGARSLAMEAIGRFGKRSGSYGALGGKVEFAYGVTDDLSVAGAILGAWYDVKNVPDFDNISRARLNGVGGEVRWRLLNREVRGIGLTLHVEPVWATSDELTGASARKWGAENKIILDTMLVPEKVYAAFNVIHEMEVVKEKGEPETERATKIGVGAALAASVMKNVFLGAEARYLHAYEGLGFNTFAGRALYVGPTLHARFDSGLWASLAWNVQVAGNEKAVAGKLDLTNFERHMVRVKVGYDF